MKIAIASGYFNPVHSGHINYFKHAKDVADFLVVILNNDKQVKVKGSLPFMDEKERAEIVGAIKFVDEVFLSVDQDGSVKESLKKIAEKYQGSELFFVNGGDRHKDNIPETEVLEKFSIKTLDSVGGGKIQSSSWLIENSRKNQKI